MKLKKETIRTLKNTENLFIKFLKLCEEWLLKVEAETDFDEALDDILEQVGEGAEAITLAILIFRGKYKEESADFVNVEFDL